MYGRERSSDTLLPQGLKHLNAIFGTQTQRVNVLSYGILYALKCYMGTLGPKYLIYGYLDPLGKYVNRTYVGPFGGSGLYEVLTGL